MRQLIKSIPVIGPLARRLHYLAFRRTPPFTSSAKYWNDRYETGGTSGDGSYNRLAKFKAETVNAFVRQRDVRTVVEFGCGDGNQLRFAEYPAYVGLDVSPRSVTMCQELFRGDPTKRFCVVDEYQGERADLALSLDVIYHLVEDSAFDEYMNRLFSSAIKFVIVYSSDTDANPTDGPPHVRHRKFSEWVRSNRSEWALISHIPNPYPFNGDTKTTSFADFFIYEYTQNPVDSCM